MTFPQQTKSPAQNLNTAVKNFKSQGFNLFFSLLILAAGCATKPVKDFSKMPSAEFEAKILVRNKVDLKSGIVNLKFKAVQNEKMRLDVLSPLMTHLASLTLVGQDLHYLLISEKRFYKGPTKPTALTPLLSLPFDPKIMHNLFFDTPISDRNWSCTKNEKGQLSECKTLTGDTIVKWISRQGEQRILEIDHARAFLQINIHNFVGPLKDGDAFFELNTPTGFKRIQI